VDDLLGVLQSRLQCSRRPGKSLYAIQPPQPTWFAILSEPTGPLSGPAGRIGGHHAAIGHSGVSFFQFASVGARVDAGPTYSVGTTALAALPSVGATAGSLD